uniref:Uncharacterized protein n=1 Tax=Photinus pyralis TaxID=7054 RepID=A0A1Y1LI77_PHOPY
MLYKSYIHSNLLCGVFMWDGRIFEDVSAIWSLSLAIAAEPLLMSMWFQQDGAIAHTARVTMDSVKGTFHGRLISLFGDVAWPLKQGQREYSGEILKSISLLLKNGTLDNG